MTTHPEGSLYKQIELMGHSFPIYYGYYSEAERAFWDPAPIFPDFLAQPAYTAEGKPFTRADQDVCTHYQPKSSVSGENWCNDCQHFALGEELIGLCHCQHRKRQNE